MLGFLDRLEEREIVMRDSLYNDLIPLKAAGTCGSNRNNILNPLVKYKYHVATYIKGKI